MDNNNSEVRFDSDQCHLVRIDKQDVAFSAAESRNLLVAMEQARQSGIYVGCRGGGCGKCRIRVLDGDYASKRMSRAWVSPQEEAEGVVLACRIFARSEMVIAPYPPELAHSYQTP